MKENISLVLKNSNFVKLWLAQFISIFVVSLLNLTLVVRLYEYTHSSVAIAVFWVIYNLPTALLGLFAGVLIDYWSKRRVILLTNLFQAVAALLYLLLETNVWPIYGVIFLYSLIDEFFRPAQEASLPSFVKKEHLPVANSLMVLSLQGAGVLGYTLSGPLMRHGPFPLPYLLGSFLLLLGALAASFLPKDQPANRRKPLRNGLVSFLDDLKEGYRIILRQRKIWSSMLLIALQGAVTTLVVALAPAIAKEILARDLREAGPLMIPPAAVGAILTGLAIDRLIKRLGRLNLTRLGFSLMGLVFLFVPFLNLDLTRNLLFIVPFSFLAGFMVVVINAAPKTEIQEQTAFNHRGRVFGTLRTLMTVASSAPMLLGAALTDFVGLRPVLSFAGLIILFLSFYLLQRNDVL